MLDDRVLIVIVSCACAEVVILRHDDETIHFSKAATGKAEATPPFAAAGSLAIVAAGIICTVGCVATHDESPRQRLEQKVFELIQNGDKYTHKLIDCINRK